MGNGGVLPTMNSYDQLTVLRWIRDRERAGEGSLHDSDLMMALEFTEEQAQSVLLALQARGDIEFKNMVLGRSGGHTLARIRLRRNGLQRLEEADTASAPSAASSNGPSVAPLLGPRRVGPVKRVFLWFRR